MSLNTYSRQEIRKARKEIQQVMKSKKTKPCTDCSNNFPYFVMDLDYTGPREHFSITKALQHVNERNLGFILTQLENSDVVCSNCHRIRDYERGTRGKR